MQNLPTSLKYFASFGDMLENFNQKVDTLTGENRETENLTQHEDCKLQLDSITKIINDYFA